jgi:protein TonB
MYDSESAFPRMISPPDSTEAMVEVMPSFPGGFSKMQKFIADNLQYPNRARKDRIEGKVYVSFVVNEDGNITDIQLQKGIANDYDEACLQMVRKMPPWEPATMNNRPVKIKISIPISFKK